MVNMECETVYETLVKPPHPITDYNTRFSGLFPEDLAGVEVTLVDVQKHILSFVSESTILMGHSLESDLRSLKVRVWVICTVYAGMYSTYSTYCTYIYMKTFYILTKLLSIQ